MRRGPAPQRRAIGAAWSCGRW